MTEAGGGKRAPRRVALASAGGLLLALVVWGLVFWDADSGPGGNPGTPVVPPPNADLPTGEPGDGTSDAARTLVGTRAEIPAPALPTPPSAEGYPQGLSGRVVGHDGAPVPGARVWLVDHPTELRGERDRMARAGTPVPPHAGMRTDVEGRFRLGLHGMPRSQRFDVQVIVDDGVHTDLRQADLRVLAGRWIDLGDLRLERAAVLTGSVTTGNNGLPVPGARLTLRPYASYGEPVAIPGRERGIQVAVDATGRYRCNTCPVGRVVVTAQASGFAGVARSDVVLTPGELTRLDFTLRRGRMLQGIVVGPAGRPVESARVIAVTEDLDQADALQVTGSTGPDGVFALNGLRDEWHTLCIQAEGYEPLIRSGIKPDSDAPPARLRLVLRASATAWLRVQDPEGRPVPVCAVLALKTRGSNSGLARIPGQQERWYGGGSAEAFIPLRGLPLWESDDDPLVTAQVRAPGFAITFSEPFAATRSPGAPQVVTLQRGATVSGTVLDPRGVPVEEAEIELSPWVDDASPLQQALRTALPTHRSEVSGRSDSQGRFRMEHLQPGVWRMTIRHPEHGCTQGVGMSLVEGATVALPSSDTTLPGGVPVAGRVLVDDAPMAQVQVLLIPLDGTRMCANQETITDGAGEWRLPAALAPGRYELVAFRPSPGQPLQQVADRQSSRREINVGAATVRVDLRIRTGR